MNPRSGENPPLISNSRSQSWRAVRSQEGHSRECAFSSLIRSGWTTRLTSSPPWGGIRWLVEAVKSLRSEEHSLNSSHSQISYAVFCLKKKKKLNYNKKYKNKITMSKVHNVENR